MASLEQLETALRNADSAGDVQAATVLANEIRRMKPAAVEAGEAVNSIPRQIGLTARYGVEGLANMAQIGTEPLRFLTDRLTGQAGKTLPLGELTSRGLDALGLPKPEGANERVIGDATRLLAGAGGLAKASQVAAQAVPKAAAYVADSASSVPGWLANFGNASRTIPQNMAVNLPQQLTSAAGAGLAGGASREAGGSPLMQGVAALSGGVAGGLVGNPLVRGLDAVASPVDTVKKFLPAQQQLAQQRIDQTINVTLQQQGIDPATINPAMRAAMREQVGKAMNTGGDLNPEAVARLADYTRLQMTPTRSRLTLDPFDVTQEQNASRLAAATGDRAARLPQIANDNNRRLLTIMDEMGGSRPVDGYGQGSSVARAIARTDSEMEQGVRSAYQAFRESTGRDLPVQLGPMRQGYQETLKDFGDVIPSAVRKQFETILNGPSSHSHGAAAPVTARRMAFDGPAAVERQAPTLSIDEAEKLIKTINRNYNPQDIAQAKALNELRGHIQQSIIGATETGAGMEAATLANFARDAARQRFQWQDSSPVIQRALGGANPDTFVQNNIISKASGFDDVAQAARVINNDPVARDAVRTAIVQQMKDASIGKGGTSETGNFSGRGLEAAIKDIGDRKLGLFFGPPEIETLKAMARTGSFETFQPRGSAVNNSNTAAGIGGLLQSVSKYVKPVANKLPMGEMAISRPLDYITASVLQRPAVNIPNSLLLQRQRDPFAQGLLLPGFAAGGTAAGLLASPYPVD